MHADRMSAGIDTAVMFRMIVDSCGFRRIQTSAVTMNPDLMRAVRKAVFDEQALNKRCSVWRYRRAANHANINGLSGTQQNNRGRRYR